jgi:hypothetical protein
MRTIKDLLSIPEGRRFLENQGITTDMDIFIAQLKPPRNPDLQQYLGSGIRKPVYAFQQIYVDVTQSMVNRIQVLDDLTQLEEVAPFFLWIDTDKAGSDKITTRMYWPHWGKVRSIPICPHSIRDIEARFVKIDPLRLEAAIDKLGMYLVQSVSGERARAAASTNFEKLEELFVGNHIRTLSEFNHHVSSFLLNEVAGLDPVSVFVSDLANGDLLTTEIEAALNQIEGIIEAFNQARADLIRRGINPVVKAFSENYLPLNYSCLVCQRRLRLHRETKQGDHFAVADCRCSQTYRFYLGRQRLSLTELAQTRRWSPDVCLALMMNDLVSGFVGGQSSGVYFGLLMKAALENALNKRRVPVLLPGISPENRAETLAKFDSLIYNYLIEQQAQVRMPEMVL